MSGAIGTGRDVAQIVSPNTGRLIGGLVHTRHRDGSVTILFGGLELRGVPLDRDVILDLEQQAAEGEDRDGPV